MTDSHPVAAVSRPRVRKLTWNHLQKMQLGAGRTASWYYVALLPLTGSGRGCLDIGATLGLAALHPLWCSDNPCVASWNAKCAGLDTEMGFGGIDRSPGLIR